jgi:hypothetical protein
MMHQHNGTLKENVGNIYTNRALFTQTRVFQPIKSLLKIISLEKWVGLWKSTNSVGENCWTLPIFSLSVYPLLVRINWLYSNIETIPTGL